MNFLGEPFFKEKGFPKPLRKTFSNKKYDKESADLKLQNFCKTYSRFVSLNLHFLCLHNSRKFFE